jgi:hypothetical protein
MLSLAVHFRDAICIAAGQKEERKKARSRSCLP